MHRRVVTGEGSKESTLRERVERAFAPPSDFQRLQEMYKRLGDLFSLINEDKSGFYDKKAEDSLKVFERSLKAFEQAHPGENTAQIKFMRQSLPSINSQGSAPGGNSLKTMR